MGRLSFRGHAWTIGAVGWVMVGGAGSLHSEENPLQLVGTLPLERSQPLLSTEVPAALGHFFTEVSALGRLGGRFLAEYQAFIFGLSQAASTGTTPGQGVLCLPPELRQPYAGALEAWDLYHRQARVVLAAERELEVYFNAGYGAGLTPDVLTKLERVVATYAVIKKQHLDFRSMLVSQLEVEVRARGCDPAAFAAGEIPEVEDPHAAAPPLPPLVPPEEEVDDEAGGITFPADPGGDGLMSREPSLPVFPEMPPPDPALAIRFTVDNSACDRDLLVFVDDFFLGEVPAGERLGFEVEEGRHGLCLTPRGHEDACVATGDRLDVLLYDGWIIRPGC